MELSNSVTGGIMEKIRVLLVDDSLVIRRALRECLRADPEIEVVGVAETGLRALEQIKALKPDVVTLDIEMPDMDGLETLRTLRANGSELPVIIFSKHTSHGATITMEALELGASDVVAKPVAHGGKGSPCEIVKRQLRSRIRALGRKNRRVLTPRPTQPLENAQATRIFQVSRPLEAVAISISTGGPSALIDVVTRLSPELCIPIFITQHMPPGFTRYLAERLAAKGPLKAVEAADGMPVESGTIYIAPGDFHMQVSVVSQQAIVALSQAPHENSCRPSADVMLRSLAHVYGDQLLSIVMTGMGQDGRNGCEYVKGFGGVIIAQDEASSLVWGMPRSVIAANLHDAVVPLDSIANLINRNCKRKTTES
jgi:two-component system chemotaxis response regulator CheB